MRTFRAVAIDFLTWLKRDKRTLLSNPEQIYIDPHIYTLPVNEPPSPTTDGKIAAQRVMSRHNTAAIEAMIRAQHSKEPTTEILQAIPKIRKYHLSRFSGLYPDETAHETPAFLLDRKVS